MFIATLFTIGKLWKREVFIQRCVGKKDVVYMHNGIPFSHRKQGNLAICNNINGP